jgi:hypothetical protein
MERRFTGFIARVVPSLSVRTYNPSVNSRMGHSELALQTRDLDARKAIICGIWGYFWGTPPTLVWGQSPEWRFRDRWHGHLRPAIECSGHVVMSRGTPKLRSTLRQDGTFRPLRVGVRFRMAARNKLELLIDIAPLLDRAAYNLRNDSINFSERSS